VLLRGDFTKNYSSTVQVYGGIREILLFHRQPVSLKHINIKELHCRQPRYEKRMPPRRNRQPPAHNLSWFSAHHRWVTIRSVLEIDAHNRRLLERFRHHVRVHAVPYFHSSHQVFVLGPHSRQYFRTSLRSSTTCRGRLKYPPPTFLTTAVSTPKSTRSAPRSAQSINGPSSTSSPFRDCVDDHAAKLFFRSAPTSWNRSRTRTTRA